MTPPAAACTQIVVLSTVYSNWLGRRVTIIVSISEFVSFSLLIHSLVLALDNLRRSLWDSASKFVIPEVISFFKDARRHLKELFSALGDLWREGPASKTSYSTGLSFWTTIGDTKLSPTFSQLSRETFFLFCIFVDLVKRKFYSLELELSVPKIVSIEQSCVSCEITRRNEPFKILGSIYTLIASFFTTACLSLARTLIFSG